MRHMSAEITRYPHSDPASRVQIKYFRSLRLKKYRRREQKFLIEGIRTIEEALAFNADIEALVFCPRLIKSQRAVELLQRAATQDITLLYSDPKAFISLTETVQSQGVLGVIKYRQRDFIPEDFQPPCIVVALNGVSDPGNVGTIIRTCDWFGVAALLSDTRSADMYNPKTLRSTAGSIFHLAVYENIALPDRIRALKAHGFTVLATVVESEAGIADIGDHAKMLLIFGNEAHGVEEELLLLSDEHIHIERRGSAESLNVAVTVGILLSAIHG